MEDFIEIIFYVVILVLSGIGSLVKNKKKIKKPKTLILGEEEAKV